MNQQRLLRAALPGTALVMVPLLAVGMAAVAVLGGGTDARSAPGVSAGGTCLTRVLTTMRTIESGGHYELHPNQGGASGGYQVIDSTWRGLAARAGVDAGVYPQAWMAPPVVQDQVVGDAVAAFLAAKHGVEDVPLYWYYPASLTDPALLDVVPMPEAGNVLTPRQYQARWLAELAREGGCPSVAAVAGPVAQNVPEPGLEQYANGAIPEERLVEVQPGRLLAPQTAAAWQVLARAAAADGVTLTITSAYRTREKQAQLLDLLGNIAEGGLAMLPGESPHGLGIAADIDVSDPRVLAWLRAHAPALCWTNAAPAREPWHYNSTIHLGCVPKG